VEWNCTPCRGKLRQVTQLDTMQPHPPSLDRGHANGRATRERLMILAEAMFAERGIEAVSLRAIGQAAGQRNNNVVQYHFGDRANLVASIYAFRSERINARRLELLERHRASGAPDDARSLLRILVQPHAESIPDPENHFLGFLARLVVDLGSMADAGSVGAEPFMGAHEQLRAGIRAASASIPDAVFERRFEWLFDFAIVTLAARKRLMPGNQPPLDDAVDEIVEIMAASLAAPVPSSAGSR
jgi:AcrR family transcriptional regulator